MPEYLCRSLEEALLWIEQNNKESQQRTEEPSYGYAGVNWQEAQTYQKRIDNCDFTKYNIPIDYSKYGALIAYMKKLEQIEISQAEKHEKQRLEDEERQRKLEEQKELENEIQKQRLENLKNRARQEYRDQMLAKLDKTHTEDYDNLLKRLLTFNQLRRETESEIRQLEDEIAILQRNLEEKQKSFSFYNTRIPEIEQELKTLNDSKLTNHMQWKSLNHVLTQMLQSIET